MDLTKYLYKKGINVIIYSSIIDFLWMGLFASLVGMCGVKKKMHIQSTEVQGQCEFCGLETKNIYIVMGKYVRACQGIHAYKAHRHEKIIHQIFEGAIKRCSSSARAMIGEEVAQGLVEYALILALVSVVVIITLSILGSAIGNVFSDIVGSI